MTQADRMHSMPPINTSALPNEKPTLPESPQSPADALYFPTPVTPEEAFQAIGRLRREARDAIDELIRFLDKTDNYVSRELEDDADAEPDDPDEASLGSFDGLVDQRKSWSTRPTDVVIEPDAELDDSDDEDGADREYSLGSHELSPAGAVSYAPSESLCHFDVEGEHDGHEPESCGLTADRACHVNSLEVL